MTPAYFPVVGAFAIIMIEHDMRFVMGLCERIAVLNFGRIIAEGKPDEIKNNPQVIEAYLGSDDDGDDGDEPPGNAATGAGVTA